MEAHFISLVFLRKCRNKTKKPPERYPNITAQMIKVIKSALAHSQEDLVLVRGFGLTILKSDSLSLSGGSWVSDRIVDFYVNLLHERGKKRQYSSVYSFPVFFFLILKKHGFQSVRDSTDETKIMCYRFIIQCLIFHCRPLSRRSPGRPACLTVRLLLTRVRVCSL